MSSTKPYLRMKAVLMMYKVFLRYPEALRPAFPKLKEKLEDPDPGLSSISTLIILSQLTLDSKQVFNLRPLMLYAN